MRRLGRGGVGGLRSQRRTFRGSRSLRSFGITRRRSGRRRSLKYVHVAGRYDGDVPYRKVGREYS